VSFRRRPGTGGYRRARVPAVIVIILEDIPSERAVVEAGSEATCRRLSLLGWLRVPTRLLCFVVSFAQRKFYGVVFAGVVFVRACRRPLVVVFARWLLVAVAELGLCPCLRCFEALASAIPLCAVTSLRVGPACATEGAGRAQFLGEAVSFAFVLHRVVVLPCERVVLRAATPRRAL